jgi:hypothetical protein
MQKMILLDSQLLTQEWGDEKCVNGVMLAKSHSPHIKSFKVIACVPSGRFKQNNGAMMSVKEEDFASSRLSG